MLNTLLPWAKRFVGWFNHHITRPFGGVTGSFTFRRVPNLQDRMLDQAKEGRGDSQRHYPRSRVGVRRSAYRR